MHKMIRELNPEKAGTEGALCGKATLYCAGKVAMLDPKPDYNGTLEVKILTLTRIILAYRGNPSFSFPYFIPLYIYDRINECLTLHPRHISKVQ